MNQQCKVCGEPAAGFHFGAFTCEGCKSFFGRSYNNLSSISECKNNGECIINKKNRTSCKACRLRKCLLVGMSKSGSRYGRRSNWFKIHCLLQEQKQKNEESRLGTQIATLNRHKDDLLLLGLDDYKTLSSPSISPPGSDSSADEKHYIHRNNNNNNHHHQHHHHHHHLAAAASMAAAAAAANLHPSQSIFSNLLPPLLSIQPHHYTALPYHPAFLPPPPPSSASPSPNAAFNHQHHQLYQNSLNFQLSPLHDDSPLDLSTKSQADTASSSAASCSGEEDDDDDVDDDDEDQEITVDCLPEKPASLKRTPLDLTTKVV